MGWKTDWLYQQVFTQFEQAWTAAQKQGRGRDDFPPAEMIVSQFNEASASSERAPIFCRGGAIRSWRYAGDDWEETPPPDFKAKENPIRGMYYETAIGSFHITSDRKSVVIEYVFGPRYGRGTVFLVHGQGPTARLNPKPDAICWVS